MYDTLNIIKKRNLLFMLFLVVSVIGKAQNKTFKLVDDITNKAITGATFKYKQQSGVSNTMGEISFQLEDEGIMQLSHVAYGEWSMNKAMLEKAIASGNYRKELTSVPIFPVTIIGLHDNNVPEQTINLNFQDKMAHDGADILTQIPAISGIRKSGNYGIDPVMRGFKYDQLNIVMNGCQTAVAACPNRMDPPTSQMSPNMMGQIEVLKGPHALRYGNGFGGTINFKSQKAQFTASNKLFGRLTGGYNSNGENLRSEGLIGFSGKAYNIGIHGAYSGGDDYKDGEGIAVKAAYARSSYGVNSAFKLWNNQKITLAAARNVANDVDFPALPMDLRKDDTWMMNAGHTIQFDQGVVKEWNTMLYGSFVDHFMDNRMKMLDPRMVDAETAAQTQSYGGRTEGTWNFMEAKMYAGADFRREEADGERVRAFLMGPNKGKVMRDNVWQQGNIAKSGVFAEYHLPKGEYQLVFSGRLELNQANASNPDEGFSQLYNEMESTQWNPGISVGINRKLDAHNTIGLWLGRVQRSGSLTERYINYFPVGVDPYEMLGNPDIKAEVNNQIDATWSFNVEKSSVSVDVFAAYLQDYISSTIDTTLKPKMPSSPGVRQYMNLDKALKSGFELTWGQKLGFGMAHKFSIAFTYGQDLVRKEALPEIAPLEFQFALYGKYFKEKFRPEIVLRQVMEQNRVSKEFGETNSPSFTLFDVGLSYKVYKNLSLLGGVHNVFDQAYFEHLSRSVKGTMPRPIYAPGRSFYISLNLDFM